MTQKVEMPNDKIKVICEQCGAITNHIVLCRVSESGSQESDDGRFSVDWWNHHEIIQCCGCDTTSFKHDHYFSEDVAPWDDNGGVKTRLFPDRTTDMKKAVNIDNMPKSIERIYVETIRAFNNHSYLLCAGGIRCMVEAVCKDKNVDSGSVVSTDGSTRISKSLDGKINGLAEIGFITKEQAKGLHSHRFLGNDALHEIISPSRKELSLSLEVLEHALEQIYQIPENAKTLEELRCNRKGRV